MTHLGRVKMYIVGYSRSSAGRNRCPLVIWLDSCQCPSGLTESIQPRGQLFCGRGVAAELGSASDKPCPSSSCLVRAWYRKRPERSFSVRWRTRERRRTRRTRQPRQTRRGAGGGDAWLYGVVRIPTSRGQRWTLTRRSWGDGRIIVLSKVGIQIIDFDRLPEELLGGFRH